MKLPAQIAQWGWQLQVRLDAGEALTWLFNHYGDRLFRYAQTLGGRRELAEDAVQEVFVRLCSDLGKLKTISHPQAYLYRAVRNQLISSKDSWCELPDADCLTSDSLTLAERSELFEALRSLPSEQREVLFLKEVLQMNFREIGEILDIPLNTAASRHRYALAKLREIFDPANLDAPKEILHA